MSAAMNVHFFVLQIFGELEWRVVLLIFLSYTRPVCVLRTSGHDYTA